MPESPESRRPTWRLPGRLGWRREIQRITNRRRRDDRSLDNCARSETTWYAAGVWFGSSTTVVPPSLSVHALAFASAVPGRVVSRGVRR